MSYDIDIVDPITKQVLVVDDAHHIRGGTYCLGGTNELSLNITYNYGKFFYDIIDKEEGIRFLYGKEAVDCIPILDKAIAALGDDVDEDYWKPTEGNAKAALIGLRALCKMRPDGILSGD